MFKSIEVRYRRMLATLARSAWLGPLLVRFTVGLVFVSSGWGKLHNLGDVSEFFASLHIPAPAAQAAFVSSVELVGGALVLVGLATRPAAALLVGVMAVAILTAKLPEIHDVFDLAGTIELAYLAMFAWLVLGGAGRASLDHLIARRRAAARPAVAGVAKVLAEQVNSV
jgi:putative oxidoreductase